MVFILNRWAKQNLESLWWSEFFTFFVVSVLVKLDAFVTADQTLTELSKALKVSSFNDSKLGICLQKLDATCLGEPKLNILLGQINPQVLLYIDLPCPCIIVLLYIFFYFVAWITWLTYMDYFVSFILLPG